LSKLSLKITLCIGNMDLTGPQHLAYQYSSESSIYSSQSMDHIEWKIIYFYWSYRIFNVQMMGQRQ